MGRYFNRLCINTKMIPRGRNSSSSWHVYARIAAMAHFDGIAFAVCVMRTRL